MWNSQIAMRKVNIGSWIAQMHMWRMKGKRERTSKVGIAQTQQHREISVQGQGIFKSFSGANQETFNRSCSKFRITRWKKQGHFDRYHGVTPIADTQLLPFPVSKAYRLWQRGTADKDPFFRQKRLTIGKKVKVYKSLIK